MGQVLMFKRDMLVWVDESGSDKRTHIRKFGYSLRGTTPTNTRLLVNNAIAAMSSSGVIALEIQKGTLNGEAFFDLIRGVLIPQTQQFNGQSSNSILVLDNEVKLVLQSAGILTFFLPPYSPDMNPIEELFSYIKQYLRRHDELLSCISNPVSVIEAAFESVTTHHCQSWISHAGYS